MKDLEKTTTVEVTEEERRLVIAYRRLKEENDFEPSSVLYQVPHLMKGLIHYWDNSVSLNCYADGCYSIWLWHKMMLEVVTGKHKG